MNKPRLYIPRKVYQKVMHFVNECSSEVSGFGLCSYVPDKNYFWVRDVFLLDQEVGSAHTDIDAEALGKLEYECLRDKREGELNFWWHSHVNMSVFWSGQDTQTINNIAKNGYCLATVFNKKNEMRSAVSFKSQFGVMFIDELDTIVYDPEPSANDIATWNDEIKAKVRERVHRFAVPEQRGFTFGDLYTDSYFTPRRKHNDNWTMPTEREAEARAEKWAKTAPHVMQDLPFFLACVITKKHPHKFDSESLHYTHDQWEQLDRITTDFINTYPNFKLEKYL